MFRVTAHCKGCGKPFKCGRGKNVHMARYCREASRVKGALTHKTAPSKVDEFKAVKVTSTCLLVNVLDSIRRTKHHIHRRQLELVERVHRRQHESATRSRRRTLHGPPQGLNRKREVVLVYGLQNGGTQISKVFPGLALEHSSLQH